MIKRALALLTATGLTLGACSRTGVAPGQARLTVGRGARVMLTRAGHPAETVTGGRTLHTGDRVKVLRGTASMALPGRASLELRGPRQNRAGSEVRLADAPALLAGDLLVRRDEGSLTVSAGGSEATVRDGAARVSRDLSITAAAYAGEVTLKTTGRSLAVPPSGRRPSPCSASSWPPEPPRPRRHRPLGQPLLGPGHRPEQRAAARERWVHIEPDRGCGA